MKAIGIKINIQNYDANTFFGTNLSSGSTRSASSPGWPRRSCPATSPSTARTPNTTNCAQNWTHSANSQVDQLMKDGARAPSTSKENTDYNKADAILWHNMVTLPLYQKPQFWAWSNNLKGVVPNTSSVGVTWNAENWSIG